MSRAKAKPEEAEASLSRMEAMQGMMKASLKAARGSRCDLWLEIGAGWYRTASSLRAIAEVEEKFTSVDARGNQVQRTITEIYGACLKGRYEAEGRPFGFTAESVASPRECRAVIIAALTAGGTAVIDGKQVRIDAAAARRLVEAEIDSAPANVAWDIATAILDCWINGREITPEEAKLPDPRRDILPPVPVDE